MPALWSGNLRRIKPCGKGLMLLILRYADEVRDAEPYFKRITSTPAADAVALARKLVGGTSGPFQPDKMPDEFADAVRELVQAKVEQRPPEVAPAPDGKAPKVINIMAALKQSVEAKGRAKVREAVRKRGGKAPATASAPKRKPTRDQRRSIH